MTPERSIEIMTSLKTEKVFEILNWNQSWCFVFLDISDVHLTNLLL